MRKNTLIMGVVLFAIGLIMWLLGRNEYDKANAMAQLYGIFGGSSQYSAEATFWAIFTIIGFILFIGGIILAIAGAVLEEKKLPVIPNPQPVTQQQIQQPVQPKTNTQIKYCPECGFQNKQDAKFCVECGRNF